MTGQWNEDMPYPPPAGASGTGWNQGGYPYPPPMAPIGWGAPHRPAKPREVELAFRIAMTALVAGLVIGALSLLVSNPLEQARAQSAARGTTLPPSFFTAIAIITGAFGIAFLAFEVFPLIRIRQGRNWARITLTVLTGIGVVFLIPSLLLQDGFTISTITTPISTLLQVAVVVLLFRPASNHYFLPRP